MGTGELVIKIDLGKYKHVDLPADKALELIEKLRKRFPNASDLGEVVRYIRNFEEFYEYMRKKFKDYLPVPHRPDDYIKGVVVVDKVKLYKEGDEKRVVIIFDRRIDVDVLKEVLGEIGYSPEEISVERMW